MSSRVSALCAWGVLTVLASTAFADVRVYQGTSEIVNGTTLTIPDVITIGASQNFQTLTAIGDGELEARVIGPAASDFPFTPISVQNGLSVAMTFAPTAPGTRRATLQLLEDDQIAFTADLDADADGMLLFQDLEEVTLGATVSADETFVGQSSVIQLIAAGPDVQERDVYVTGQHADEFLFSLIPINGNLHVAMSFMPMAEGQRSATLNFVDSDFNVFDVQLVGQAHAAVRVFQGETEVAFNESVSALDTVVGHTSQLQFTGVAADVSGMVVVVTGEDADDFPFTAFGEQQLLVAMSFSPTDAGVRQATLRILDGDTILFSMELQGVGLEPVRVFDGFDEINDGGTFTAPDTLVSGSVDFQLMAANATGMNVDVSGPAADEFPLSVLFINGDMYISLSFAPQVSGLRAAQLQIVDNGATMFTVYLRGSGYRESVAVFQEEVELVDGESLAFDQTPLRERNTISLAAINAVGLDVQVIGEHAAEFAVQVTPDDDHLNLDVIFSPTEIGERLATLQWVDNSNAVFSLGLEGKGTGAPDDIAPEPGAPVAPVSESDGDFEGNTASSSGETSVEVIPVVDCDGNGTDDEFEIATAPDRDCDTNGILDACEADSDSDGSTDACDVCEGEDDRVDADGNGTPDCLESDRNEGLLDGEVISTDCDGNGIDDIIDIAEGDAFDCNTNNVPDACEPDSDVDGAIDGCDLCPDMDDFEDFNGDGLPDCVQSNNMCGAGSSMTMPLMLGLLWSGMGCRRSATDRRIRTGR
jgi:hypothetical protein